MKGNEDSMEEQYEDMQVGDKLYKYRYRYRFGNVFEASDIREYEVVKVNPKTIRIRNIITEKEELVKKAKVSFYGYERFNQVKYDAIQKEKIVGMIEAIGYDIRYEDEITYALLNMSLDEVARYHSELSDITNRIITTSKRK